MKTHIKITPQTKAYTGVIIVSYCSGDYLLECLESLLSSTSENLKIVVCDNASPDDTVENLRLWANGDHAPEPTGSKTTPTGPIAPKPVNFSEYTTDETTGLIFDQINDVTLVRLPKNLGFAGGVNVGIALLEPHPEIDLFWILNPDCQVEPYTAAAYRECATKNGNFGLMGSRLVYMDPPNVIQSDGGAVNQWTGFCRNLNQGAMPEVAEFPDIGNLDFVSGSNVVASRDFIEKVGLMAEGYFLYYEEVDWAARRADLPIVWCKEALVYHHGGTTIGSGAVGRIPTGFANYFNFRNRIWYVKTHHPTRLPTTFLYSTLKIGQLLLRGAWEPAIGATRGLFGLPPSPAVLKKVGSESAPLAFKKKL